METRTVYLLAALFFGITSIVCFLLNMVTDPILEFTIAGIILLIAQWVFVFQLYRKTDI